jgi:hypothetical protein
MPDEDSSSSGIFLMPVVKVFVGFLAFELENSLMPEN